MCMVFRHKVNKNVKFGERLEDEDLVAARGLQNPSAEAQARMEGWKARRQAILKSLQNCGLEIYCYYSRDLDEVIVKIGARPEKLRETAARMKYKLQLKPQYLSAYAEYRFDNQGRQERQFKDRRIISHIYKTHTEDDFVDSDSIFKTLDKISLIHHIITSTDKDCAGLNIGELMHSEELLVAYFPLHEASAMRDFNGNKWSWFIPSDEMAQKLRDYFGERVACYFLFMGFYLKWLIPLSLVGMALQIIDWLAMTPDNLTSILFCVVMSVWAMFMPHFWRRQEAKYAISWGTLDLVESLEPCRPEHTGERMINPVTAQVEPHYPFHKRVVDYMVSAAVLAVTSVLLVFVLAVLLLIRHDFKNRYNGPFVFEIIIAAYVEVSNGLLNLLGRKLTSWENHRTQKEHETHILIKVMVLKFLNSYFVLFYIAFFKQHQYLFGAEMKCWQDDCLLDLQGQLGVFVLFRISIANVIEYFMPRMKLAWRSWILNQKARMSRAKGGHAALQADEFVEMSHAEQQSKKDTFDEFSNFDEVLVAHGYMTMFAVSAPMVCAATFIGTVIEIFIDFRGLLVNRQRTLPFRARSNEPWNTAFEIYGAIAGFTNAFLLIFATEQYASWTLTEKIVLFLYLEHAVFFARLLVRFMLPEVPKNVEVLKLKQDNMVHRCLENIKEHEVTPDYSMFRDNRGNEKFEVFEQDLFEEDEQDVTFNFAQSKDSLQQGIHEEIKAVAKSLNTLTS